MPYNDAKEVAEAKDDRSTINAEYWPPIPESSDSWQTCVLGHPQTWSSQLQAYTFTIACLAYPAALIYGDNFVLLHNKAWGGISGNKQQGRAQRGRLSADVWEAFQAGLHGQPAKQVKSHDLLRGGLDPSREEHTVSLSPLHDSTSKEVVILLVQLLPREPISFPADLLPVNCVEHKEDCFDGSKGELSDSTPLDKHPFFHRFAEMLPCGLAILDRDAQAVYVNQVFYTMTTHRKSNQDFYGWPESIHPDDKDRVLDAYRDAFANQRKLRTEFRSQGDGVHLWRLLLLTPLGDDNLEHVSLRESGGFICCIVDISSEKFAELNERRAAREAEERKVVLTSFIDMVSHEIRNPLSAVLHCAEDISDAILQKPVDVHAVEEAVETINVCIAHQKNIVDDVLSFSKLDASMLTLLPSPCQPAPDIADALKMFQPELRKTGIGFTFDVDESYRNCEVAWVMADLPRINQIIVNLLSNAIKFTAHSENPKKITVSLGASHDRPTSYPYDALSFNLDEKSFHMDATQSKEWGTGQSLYIMVAVKDTGIGISEINQQKLFERFRQATPKTAETYGGSGLGLNISRKLCQLHGGEIGVSAREGEGSTFAFFFKIRKIEKPVSKVEGSHGRNLAENKKRSRVNELTADTHERTDSRPVSVTTDRTNDPKPENMGSTAGTAKQEPTTNSVSETSDKHNKTHILLVEDNIVNQRILSKRLQSKGFAVTTADNGREAVNAVVASPKPSSGEQDSFDIILMDNEMPILDGNNATKELRNMEELKEIERIPILGVTANVRGAQQEEMIRCGMDDVISKPYRMNDMIEKIDKMIEAEKK